MVARALGLCPQNTRSPRDVRSVLSGPGPKSIILGTPSKRRHGAVHHSSRTRVLRMTTHNIYGTKRCGHIDRMGWRIVEGIILKLRAKIRAQY